MRKTMMFAGMAGAVLLLGACSGGKPEGGAADGNAAASTEAAPGSASAEGSAPASPKEGLWEMKVTAAGAPQPQVMKVCVGAPAPGSNGFTPPPSAGQSCSKNSVTKTADGYAIDSECTASGMTVTSKGTVTGDFSTSYAVDMSSKMSGPNIPAAAQQEMKTKIEAQYLGACPADMKPGQSKLG